MATFVDPQRNRQQTGTRAGTAQPAAASEGVTIPRWRISTTLLLCTIIVGITIVRLAEVQIIERAHLAEMARNEINRQITLHPSRGQIKDRSGNVLAMDIERESLWVIPSLIPPERVNNLALTLSTLLQKDHQVVLEALTNSDLYWLPLQRWLDPSLAERIEALDEPGLRLVYEPLRVYPQDSFAAHIIGAVNREGDGISGVESFYNTQLKGITGTLIAEFDAAKNPIAIAPQESHPPRDGMDLVLTIDPMVQYIAEKELQAAVEDHEADGGSVLIIETSTGAIRGMASWPTFDLNRYQDYPPEIYGRNPAISNVYEPGSTFKIITVAAGLQSGAFTAETQVNDSGVIARYGYNLKNWNALGNGMINPADVLYHSSNVGALQLNELTNPENFYRIVQDFGFGKPTGIDLGGEEQGIVNSLESPDYNDLTFLTNGYGQGISMTPLQLVRAVAAIANDGTLMQPYVVEERCEGDTCTRTTPTEVAQVVDPGVAWTIRRMLVRSANHYAPVVWAERTGSFADQWLVPGYEVGAKTGTASIPLPGGSYDPNFTIGSVVGFAPAEDARYAVLVKVDRPKDDIWGVRTAVPLYCRIVEQLMDHERIPPDPGLFDPGQ